MEEQHLMLLSNLLSVVQFQRSSKMQVLAFNRLPIIWNRWITVLRVTSKPFWRCKIPAAVWDLSSSLSWFCSNLKTVLVIRAYDVSFAIRMGRHKLSYLILTYLLICDNLLFALWVIIDKFDVVRWCEGHLVCKKSCFNRS